MELPPREGSMFKHGRHPWEMAPVYFDDKMYMEYRQLASILQHLKAKKISDSMITKVLLVWAGLPDFMNVDLIYRKTAFRKLRETLGLDDINKLITAMLKSGLFDVMCDDDFEVTGFYNAQVVEYDGKTHGRLKQGSMNFEKWKQYAEQHNINYHKTQPKDEKKDQYLFYYDPDTGEKLYELESTGEQKWREAEKKLDPIEAFFVRLIHGNSYDRNIFQFVRNYLDELAKNWESVSAEKAERYTFTPEEAERIIEILTSRYLVPYINSNPRFMTMSHHNRCAWLWHLLNSRKGKLMIRNSRQAFLNR